MCLFDEQMLNLNYILVRAIFFILLLSLTTLIAYSQENPRINKKTFFEVEEGKDAAKGAFKIAENTTKRGMGLMTRH